MSEINVIAKERIAYLKLWLGIMIITDISLAGWLISNFNSAAKQIVFGCMAIVFAITIGLVIFHRRIEQYINNLRED